MYKNKSIYWEEGTLLQPQHFQTMDARLAPTCALLSHLATPFAYGVRSYGIREEALLTGTFSFSALDVLMPTGEHLVLGENTYIPSRAFLDAWTEPEEPLFAYLALPLMSPNERNVTVCAHELFAQATTRFVAQEHPTAVPNVYDGTDRADVRFMDYNARILVGKEVHTAHNITTLPVARLLRDGDVIRLDKEYVPPCLNVHAIPFLLDIAQSIRNTLLARTTQLDDYKMLSIHNTSEAGVTLRSLELTSMLRILSQYLPYIEHCLEADSLHPWMLYGVLRQLIGELSLFSTELSALGENMSGTRVVPPYSHANMGACFEAAHMTISRLAGALVTGPAHTLDFEEIDESTWFCRIPAHIRSSPFAWWLYIRSGDDMEGLTDHIQKWVKLAPMEQLPTLVTRSLPGIALIPTEAAPAGLPRRSDTLYFTLDQTDTLWSRVLTTGELGMFLPKAPQHMRIHLAIMNT